MEIGTRREVLWGNAVVVAAAVLLLASLVVHFPGIVDDEARPQVSWFLQLPLRALLLIALADGMSGLRTPCERRFWTLCLAAFASWFIADMAFESAGDGPVVLGVLEDAAFLVFYPLMMLAVEQRPCRYHWPLREWGTRFLCAASGLLLLLWAYFYVVVLPLVYSPEVFLSEAPSYAFFATADFIFFTIFLLRTTNRRGRWRVIYAWLAAAMLGWAVSDLLDALSLIGYDVIGYGTPLDVIWSMPYLAVVVAAVYRNRSSKRFPPVAAATAHGWTLVMTGYLYAAGVSVIHLVYQRLGWLPELQIPRVWAALTGTIVLLFIAIAIHIGELRRRRSTREPRVVVLEEEIQRDQRMEALGRLAGGIAHDFNNLLMVLQGQIDCNAERIRQLPDGQSLITELETIVRRGSDLSHQLLAFGRRQVTQVEVVDPARVVAETESLLKRVLGADIELGIDVEPGLWSISINRGQLSQILINLGLNARAAMPDGGRLHIKAGNVVMDERTEDGIYSGDFVQIEVSDTGRGMDEETQSRIFEPFFRRGEDGAGFGLGLAVVYGIVKQHKGYISCDSVEGVGTTFRIQLPRAAADTSDEPTPQRLPRQSLGGNETILLAEDEDDVRRPVAEYLRSLGYDVLEATNGVEALDIVDTYRGTIHLLISDIVMPGVGGLELADRLTVSRPNAKAFFVTGYALDLPMAGGDGANRLVLEKPYSLGTLAATVRDVLDSD